MSSIFEKTEEKNESISAAIPVNIYGNIEKAAALFKQKPSQIIRTILLNFNFKSIKEIAEDKNKNISVQIPQTLREKINSAAKEMNVSPSLIVRTAIVKYNLSLMHDIKEKEPNKSGKSEK